MGRVLSRSIDAVTQCSLYLGFVALAAMGLIVSADVSGRFFFNRPLAGGPELVEELMVCVIFFFLPYVTKIKRHIEVEVFYEKMPPGVQRILSITFDILVLGALALLAWQGIAGSLTAMRSGEVTVMLRISHFPFHIVLSFGFTMAFFTHLMNLYEEFRGNVS